MKKEKKPENIAMGNRLREIRSDQGLQQQEMAAALKMEKSTYNQIENGFYSLKKTAQHVLEMKYGVNPAWLAGNSTDRYKHNPELSPRYWEYRCKELEKIIARQELTIEALAKAATR